MIPTAYITRWSAVAPWPTELQIEQDLVLSRLIVEIANSPELGPELALRGGTCLHKLHLPTALRYSEDLDYVRRTTTPGGAIVDALRDLTARVGLTENRRVFKRDMITFVCGAPGESSGMIRIKIETNIAETDCYLPRTTVPYAVKNPWFSGEAEVSNFELDELMSTKFRALYQRTKGRDLFDLWHTLETCEIDDVRIVAGLYHYMKDAAFTYPQLAQNLRAKLADPEFAADLESLVVSMPSGYSPQTAADLVIERLGSHLRNAPRIEDVEGGAWRA